MKLKNGEIFAARKPLQKLIERELPVRVSFALAKLGIKLNEQVGAIEQVRSGLVKKYGKPDKKNPQDITVDEKGKDFQKFVDEYNELMNQETELVFDVVKLPEMVDGVALQVEPQVLMALDKFLVLE